MHFSFRQVGQPDDRFPFSHASSLCQLQSGQLVCFWFSGSLEGHADVVIRSASLDAGGAMSALAGPEWTIGNIAVDARAQPAGNPVPHVSEDGCLSLFHVTFPPRRARECILRLQSSSDGGQTWGEPRALTDLPGYWPRHPIIETDERWLLPLCNIDIRPPISMVWISEDLGKNWREVAIPFSDGLIQPCIVEAAAGELHCYLRDMACQEIRRSLSHDGGLSWSTPERTSLANNNSGFSCISLENGDLLMAFNDGTRRVRRSRITVALSKDRGVNWTHRRIIVPYDEIHAAKCQNSYPYLIQDPAGMIHMSLTYRSSSIAHYSFDGSWIEANHQRLAVPAAELYARPPYDIRRLHLNETIYLADKATELTSAPDELYGKLAICPNNDKGETNGPDEEPFRLVLNRPVNLIVALIESTKPKPDWLAGFDPYPGRIETTDGVFDLHSRALNAGEHMLGQSWNDEVNERSRWFGFLIADSGYPASGK